MPGVDDHDAAGHQPVAGEPEELARGQVERDVGLAVGVDHDRLPALLGPPQERPGVLRVELEARPVAQAEPAAAQLGQLAVDLHAVDPRAGEELPVGAHRRAGAVAEDGQRARRAAEHADGRGEVAVPHVVGQHGVGSPDGMEGLALVELQAALAVGQLDHARVLVGRLALLEHAHAVGRLRGPGRHQQRRADRDRHQQVPARQRERRDERRPRRRRAGTSAASRRAGRARARPGTSRAASRPWRARRGSRPRARRPRPDRR